MLGTLLTPIVEAPRRSAVLLDVDGVLAPIVERPEDAAVPEATRVELRRLADRYRLVAGVSGRTGDDAARIVGVPGMTFVGSHGLELDPDAGAWRERMRTFADGVDWPVEDKGVTISLHYRTAADEPAAKAYLEQVAGRAKAAGLVARFGRKVLELRPPLTTDKGTAVRRLLLRHGIARALYAGDDTTDLDAFRGLTEAELEVAVRVAVSSPEGPAELLRQADVVVDGTGGVLELLRAL